MIRLPSVCPGPAVVAMSNGMTLGRSGWKVKLGKKQKVFLIVCQLVPRIWCGHRFGRSATTRPECAFAL